MVLGFIILFLILLITAGTIVALTMFLISEVVSNAHGVPYVPIRRKLIKGMLSWGGLSGADIFYDLGCGDARVLICAVRDFGIKRAIGYDIAVWSYLKARFFVWQSGSGSFIKIIFMDFLKAELDNATFLYAYLFPEPINVLAAKLAKELSAGAKVLCPSFPIDIGRHPEFKLLKSAKFDKITVYLYQKV